MLLGIHPVTPTPLSPVIFIFIVVVRLFRLPVVGINVVLVFIVVVAVVVAVLCRVLLFSSGDKTKIFLFCARLLYLENFRLVFCIISFRQGNL